MTRIVIEVSGGCVGNVYSDDPNLEVNVLDHDDIDGGGSYVPQDWKGGDFDGDEYQETIAAAHEKSERNKE